MQTSPDAPLSGWETFFLWVSSFVFQSAQDDIKFSSVPRFLITLISVGFFRRLPLPSVPSWIFGISNMSFTDRFHFGRTFIFTRLLHGIFFFPWLFPPSSCCMTWFFLHCLCHLWLSCFFFCCPTLRRSLLFFWLGRRFTVSLGR